MQYGPPPVPCTGLLQGLQSQHMGTQQHCWVKYVTLTPGCLLQASRHFQLKAPLLGVIFGTHGGGSCWLMNTAEIKYCHLILVIWGLWSAVLIPARTPDPECQHQAAGPTTSQHHHGTVIGKAERLLPP